MARRSLADMKSAYQTPSDSEGSRPNNYYPFYNMDFDEKATIRFLPDLNEENPLGFLLEKLTHNLIIDGEKKNVPCLKMYEDNCPICKQSAAFYKEDADNGIEDSPRGKALYRRKQHLAQVLVVQDPLKYKEGQESAAGTVKLVNLGFSIYNKITEAFKEDELEEVPDDYEAGTDFMIKKVKKGKWANYDNSKFLKRERALTESELAVVEGSLIDLSSLLPKNPTAEHLEKMLTSHITNAPMETTSTPSQATSREESVSSVDTVKTSASTISDAVDVNDADADDVDAILADIRRRRKA